MWKDIFFCKIGYSGDSLATEMSREIIAKPDYPFLSYSTPTVVWPLAFSMLHTHFGESPVASHSRDLVAKILWMLTHLNSSHSSHTQPLHNSHLNIGYLIAEIQTNLARNKANTWLNKFNPTKYESLSPSQSHNVNSPLSLFLSSKSVRMKAFQPPSILNKMTLVF